MSWFFDLRQEEKEKPKDRSCSNMDINDIITIISLIIYNINTIRILFQKG